MRESRQWRSEPRGAGSLSEEPCRLSLLGVINFTDAVRNHTTASFIDDDDDDYNDDDDDVLIATHDWSVVPV